MEIATRARTRIRRPVVELPPEAVAYRDDLAAAFAALLPEGSGVAGIVYQGEEDIGPLSPISGLLTYMVSKTANGVLYSEHTTQPTKDAVGFAWNRTLFQATVSSLYGTKLERADRLAARIPVAADQVGSRVLPTLMALVETGPLVLATGLGCPPEAMPPAYARLAAVAAKPAIRESGTVTAVTVLDDVDPCRWAQIDVQGATGTLSYLVPSSVTGLPVEGTRMERGDLYASEDAYEGYGSRMLPWAGVVVVDGQTAIDYRVGRALGLVPAGTVPMALSADLSEIRSFSVPAERRIGDLYVKWVPRPPRN